MFVLSLARVVTRISHTKFGPELRAIADDDYRSLVRLSI